MSADQPSTNEQSPLLQNSEALSPSISSFSSPDSSTTASGSKPVRSVSFDPNPTTRTFEVDPVESRRARPRTAPQLSRAAAPPVAAAVNLSNKLRHRNSAIPGTSPGTVSPVAQLAAGPPVPKVGAQRTTKNAQKLKILPTPELDEENQDYESGCDVYSQYTRIKDPTARRDAARLGKDDRQRLPRVTAYSVADLYQMDNILHFLKGKRKRGANPKSFDECIYSPYSYSRSSTSYAPYGTMETPIVEEPSYVPQPDVNPVKAYERRHSTGSDIDGGFNRQELMSIAAEQEQQARNDEFPALDTEVHTPEVFIFQYGVVVIWGMSELDEKRFLGELSRFILESREDVEPQTELFNFYYTNEYQARIYNDFITLRDRKNYMTKLAISHALAQSVQTSVYEDLVSNSIDSCKDIPAQIALTGKIGLSRKQINMAIADLFNLRIGIHAVGSVLDTPELFWDKPQFEPVYQAVREYLELDQRLSVLNDRLDVIADLLAVLKEQLSHGHGEMLEWIVIVLVAMEVIVAAVNIFVDLYVGPE